MILLLELQRGSENYHRSQALKDWSKPWLKVIHIQMQIPVLPLTNVMFFVQVVFSLRVIHEMRMMIPTSQDFQEDEMK